MRRINQNEGFRQVVNFKEDGIPVTPSTIHWRVTRKVSGDVVQDWTAVGSVSSSVTITVPGSLNTLADFTTKVETRLLTVVADMDTDLEYNQDFEYTILQSGR